MNSSGQFAHPHLPEARAPYPSGTLGDWRMFMVGVVLIAVFLCALAFSPSDDDAMRGIPAIDDLVVGPAVPPEALALRERDTQAVGRESVYPYTQAAGDL